MVLHGVLHGYSECLRAVVLGELLAELVLGLRRAESPAQIWAGVSPGPGADVGRGQAHLVLEQMCGWAQPRPSADACVRARAQLFVELHNILRFRYICIYIHIDRYR